VDSCQYLFYLKSNASRQGKEVKLTIAWYASHPPCLLARELALLAVMAHMDERIMEVHSIPMVYSLALLVNFSLLRVAANTLSSPILPSFARRWPFRATEVPGGRVGKGGREPGASDRGARRVVGWGGRVVGGKGRGWGKKGEDQAEEGYEDEKGESAFGDDEEFETREQGEGLVVEGGVGGA
jgi:hypothetical protein